MPKRVLPLSDLKINKAKPQEKEYCLFDGGGLYLAVTPSGGKLWRIKYRFEGKSKLLHLGTYPVITLAEARQKLLDTKRTVANGIDPGAVKKAQKQTRLEKEANSFEVIAREWHQRYIGQWTEGHSVTIMSRLERDVFPYLGSEPVEDIKASMVLQVLRRVESRGALESAHRIRTVIGQVLRYAVATGRAERDCTGDLKGALPPATKNHLAALTEPKDVAPLLRAIDGFQGSFVVKCALQLLPLIFLRSKELQEGEWSEIDFEGAQWNIPGPRMKMKLPHIVPLSDQAIAILKELKPLNALVAIRGNHEDMLFRTLTGDHDPFSWHWMEGWGKKTLFNFGVKKPEELPLRYRKFLAGLPYYLEDGDFILVHAGINLGLTDPLIDTRPEQMVWESTFIPDAGAIDLRRVVCGHRVHTLDDVKNSLTQSIISLDNGAFTNQQPAYGNLVALNLDTMQLTIQPRIDRKAAW